MPGCRSASIPGRSLDVIWRQLTVARVNVTDESRRFCVSGQRGAAQPGFSRTRIFLDIPPFDEGKPPTYLRRAVPTFGCMAKEFACDVRITLRPRPLLGENAEQVDRCRYLSLGSLAQQPGNPDESLFVCRLPQQGQGVAKAAFGTAR